MTLPYPLPRETRSTGPQAFDGVSVTFGPFAFRTCTLTINLLDSTWRSTVTARTRGFWSGLPGVLGTCAFFYGEGVMCERR